LDAAGSLWVFGESAAQAPAVHGRHCRAFKPTKHFYGFPAIILHITYIRVHSLVRHKQEQH
jgi:hypothetical protein